MCVILHRPEGITVDWEDLLSAYWANSDGCGLMWFDGPKVRVSRGMWSDDEMLDRVCDLGEREYILHLRIATHGVVSRKNCHPFPVGGGGWVAHNGILRIKQDREDRSDTWHFARNFREGQFANKLSDAGFVKMLEKAHGEFNRLAFALPGGRVVKTGSWKTYAGCEWSNLNWVGYRSFLEQEQLEDDEEGTDEDELSWQRAWDSRWDAWDSRWD